MTLTIRKLTFDDFISLLDLAEKIDIIDPIEKMLSGSYRDQIISKIKAQEAEKHKLKVLSKDEVETENIPKNLDNSTEIEQVGYSMIIEIIKLIINRIPTNRKEIYNFFGKVTETDADIIANLGIKETMELITDFFTKSDLKELGNLYRVVNK